jgi:hypothetical protein
MPLETLKYISNTEENPLSSECGGTNRLLRQAKRTELFTNETLPKDNLTFHGRIIFFISIKMAKHQAGGRIHD